MGMKEWVEQSPVAVGIALVVAGFVAIFLAWNGAAGKDLIEQQFPYLISGGVVGLGLIGSGLTVIVVQARRADTKELASKMEELTEALRGTGGTSRPSPRSTPSDRSATGPISTRPRKKTPRRTRERS
jgi:hypothetical protein